MEKYFITGSNYFIDKNIKLFTPKDEDLSIEIFFGDELNFTIVTHNNFL